MLRLVVSFVFAFCGAAKASDGARPPVRRAPAVLEGEDGGPKIRVAIARNSPSIKLKTSAKTYLVEVKTGQKYLLLANASYDIKRAGEQSLSVADQTLSSPIKLLSADGSEKVRLGGNIYKGDILINAVPGGRLNIIEYLPLEDYLYGVLPSEMSAGWPLEALKAQAVASRSYAVKNLAPGKDYDVTDGIDTQVYNGTKGINSRILEAVNATRGEVLKYKGKIVTAFFHACCGGHTGSARAAWGEEVGKPLSGVSDPFCSGSFHHKWHLGISVADMLSFIQAKGSTALKIKGIRLYKKDRSGRVITVLFVTDQGKLQVKVTDIRKRFGNSDFKSLYLTSVVREGGYFEFSGRGWGHGVGMCQEGAKEMAKRGMSYKKILRHYYPGASITDYGN
ncbi:MAG: hypothetical protein A2021_00920 [Elusimicrobia bacterium GWF2_52_66]|nr:MAG: hypothetical protein A2X33_06605 [Elusimicrobia bacterium GWA2_51_34]OGR88155.1 MAG: hypothetical protein A2021_00920 [Elusimicrobia bacterium GWF2_52_66]HAF95358.1 hypothetical protein [Elusimicrobiota bacterium]HCE98778.1 hypothetical protein [Elusimicrobiota bacterium]